MYSLAAAGCWARASPQGFASSRRGGTVEPVGDHLAVRDADAVTILVAAATDFRHDDHERACRATLDAAASRSFAELRARHVESHRPPMRRVRLRLGGRPDEALAALPTDVRLERVKAGRSTLASSNCTSSSAATCCSVAAARAPCRPTCRGSGTTASARLGQQVHDQHQPADELLAGRGREPGRVSRPALRPDRPASCHRRGDGTPALRLPWLRRPPQHRPLGGHGSARQRLLRALARGRGVARLPPLGALRVRARRRVPPRARLPGDERGGALRARLPDRGSRDRRAAVRPVALARETSTSTCTAFAPASAWPRRRHPDHRGLCSTAAPGRSEYWASRTWIGEERAAHAPLPQPTIGRFGQLQEWRDDHEEWEPGHRHLSHLFAVYPDPSIGVREPARSSHGRHARRSNGASLAAAAVRGGGARGSCCSGHAFHEASCTRTLALGIAAPRARRSRTCSTLTRPRGRIRSLSSRSTATSAHGRGLRDAVAVARRDRAPSGAPAAWPSGNVRGLRARGGFELDLRWADHRLTEATVVATVDGPLRVLSPDPLAALTDGSEVVTEAAVADDDRRPRPDSRVPTAPTRDRGGPPRRAEVRHDGDRQPRPRGPRTGAAAAAVPAELRPRPSRRATGGGRPRHRARSRSRWWSGRGAGGGHGAVPPDQRDVPPHRRRGAPRLPADRRRQRGEHVVPGAQRRRPRRRAARATTSTPTTARWRPD